MPLRVNLFFECSKKCLNKRVCSSAIAFQICMTCYRRKSTVWPGKLISSKKTFTFYIIGSMRPRVLKISLSTCRAAGDLKRPQDFTITFYVKGSVRPKEYWSFHFFFLYARQAAWDLKSPQALDLKRIKGFTFTFYMIGSMRPKEASIFHFHFLHDRQHETKRVLKLTLFTW